MASMDDMGAWFRMLVVETVAKIRRAYFVQKKTIKAICRELRVSRKVVRKGNTQAPATGCASRSAAILYGKNRHFRLILA